MSVTIKDVAKAAGVSHTTVSRALHNNPTIAVETAANIKRLAEEMGYVPNHVARGLKMKRSAVLGVIVRRIDDPFFAQVIKGIEDVLQAAGYSLFLAASYNQPTKDNEIILSMTERRVDGVIICSTQLSPENRRKLTKLGVQTVLINNQADPDAEYAIYHDDAFGSRSLTEHLLELGHERIAYIGNAIAGVTNYQRQLGYQRALTEAGIVVHPEYILPSHNGQADGGAQAVEQLLTHPNRPTALVCFNDMVAMGAIYALTSNGLRVPQDCSITGFDNIAFAPYMIPALTTFDQPKYELGKEAATMMLCLLQKDNHVTSHVQLRGKLIQRNSTAPLERKDQLLQRN